MFLAIGYKFVHCLSVGGFPNVAAAEAYLSPAVDESVEPFSWSMPDLDLLRQYVLSLYNYTIYLLYVVVVLYLCVLDVVVI